MSDYESAQRRRDVIVGIFVILGLAALGWMIFKFGDLPTAVSRIKSFQVYVKFPTAPGVQKDTPVRFCGYQIGRVTTVMAPRIMEDSNTGREYHQTLVVLSIDKSYTDIPSNVEAKLMTRGLGSSYIELKVNPETLPAPPLDPNHPETAYLTEGLTLQGSKGMTSEFFPEESQKKLNNLVDDIGTFIGNANDIIGDPNNKENVKATLAHMSDATENISIAMQRATEVMDSASRRWPNTRVSPRPARRHSRVPMPKPSDWSHPWSTPVPMSAKRYRNCGWPWRRSTRAKARRAVSSTTGGSTRSSSRAPSS